MQRRAYADFDEFADSLSGVAGRFVPTARSSSDWWIENARAGRIRLQQVQVGGATTFAGDGASDHLSLGLPLTDPAAIRIDGQPLAANAFVLAVNNQPFTFSSRQLTRWISITVPLERLNGSAPELLSPVAGGTRSQARQQELDEVRALALRICGDQQPVSIVEPAAVAAAEEELLHTVTGALAVGARAIDRHIGRPQVSRTRVIARCLELIDATEGQPLFIDDLCTATQVSERTLRNIFQEYFSVGPMRLLKVRQLREIRSALLKGDPVLDTVTKIAARFGVWDFSLFARNYRALYGEAPSQTLRRPRGVTSERRDDGAVSPTWIGYASRRFSFGLPMPALEAGESAGADPRS
ncbi:MAG TPA: helix-turn-helix transcriptional regulator [Povalibacter sp.]|uniref:AraC family transcriptional regulator n=1 Tax=Povalibacter sp. TaxID=1962978 RepID=UPI002CF9F22F|nr:helix-turn-helix transcriptional regulator [Povalibacter sp.]HMN45613.1 helix-turn-helix transcriptional regulator [Povalibacter sp.]